MPHSLRFHGWLPVCCAGICCALAGCAGTAVPTLCPGSEQYQLAVAKKFDPYADPTVGGDMTGARPRGFLDPRAQPDPAKLQPFVAAPAGPPPAQTMYPPAQYVYPAGSASAPAGYPAGTVPGVIAPGTSVPAMYPPTSAPPGAVYLPGAATAPPLGTTSSVVPAQNGLLPLMPIPAAPSTSKTAVIPAAYGTAINAPP